MDAHTIGSIAIFALYAAAIRVFVTAPLRRQVKHLQAMVFVSVSAIDRAGVISQVEAAVAQLAAEARK